jgi:hypothetical protein
MVGEKGRRREVDGLQAQKGADMIRTITRTVEIDCEDKHCGRCHERTARTQCRVFGKPIDVVPHPTLRGAVAFERLLDCRAAEAAKPGMKEERR